MGATSREKDFSHLLFEHGVHVINIKNVSKDVEMEPGQHSPDEFKDLQADIVILKFGENINTERLPKFIIGYQKLIDYFVSHKSKVICVGSFWDIKPVNAAI